MVRSNPTRWRPRVAVFLVVVLAGLVLAACASGAADAPIGPGAAASPASRDATDDEGGSRGGPAGGPAQPDAAPRDGRPGSAGGDGSGGAGTGSGDGSDDGSGTGSGTGAAFRDLARIVYTGSLTLEVARLADAVKAARDAVLATGGYVGASRQTTEAAVTTASITYRIPAGRWEETLEALRGLGTVESEQIDSAEVTGQIVDLQARIRNLRVSEAAIQAIAAKAATFDEILDGQARLASVREEIERLDAQLQGLEGQADLGTLTVSFQTPSPAPPPRPVAEEPAWDPRGEVTAATATLLAMLQGLASVGIWFGIVWLPVLALILALAIAVRLVLRRSGVLERVSEPAGPSVPGS